MKKSVMYGVQNSDHVDAEEAEHYRSPKHTITKKSKNETTKPKNTLRNKDDDDHHHHVVAMSAPNRNPTQNRKRY